MLRVNLRGREPAGTVEPGEEYDALVRRLEEDLRALRLPDSGAPALERVSRLRGAGGGPPPRAPDVVGIFAPHEEPLLRLEHPRAAITQPRPWWDARNGHAGTGSVIAAGPGIAGGACRDAMACADLAPTVLALMGEPIGAGMAGRPAAALLAAPRPGWRKSPPDGSIGVP